MVDVYAGHILQHLFERAPDGLVVTRLRDGRVVLVNEAISRLLGYPPSDLIGRTADEFGLWPELAGRSLRKWKAMAGGSRPPTEAQLRTRDGRIVDIEVSSEIVDIDGEPHAFGITRDITARKQAERALRANEERYRTLVQSSRDAIMVTDASGRLTYCSPGVEFILGYRVEDLVGTPERDLIHPDDLRIRDRLIGRLLEGLSPQPMAELRMRHRDGTWRWIETIDTNRLDSPAIAGIVTNARDVTERKLVDEAVSFRSLHDPLTGLPNRRLLDDRIELAVARASRSRKIVAVLFCDLDHFKDVNDRMGHEAGDELLRITAERLLAALRPSDSLARIGGDEFVVVCGDLSSADEAAHIAERLRSIVSAPAELSGGPIAVTASIGIATIQGSRHTPPGAELLMRNADAAMYRAKTRGRDRWDIFDAEMEDQVRLRMELVEHLGQGLKREEFVVHYQPVVSLSDGAIVGAEALLRWRNPGRVLRLPAEFLDAAEDSGLIVAIGAWVIEQAVDQLEAWQKLRPTPLWVSVNISARQLGEGALQEILSRRLGSGSLAPGSLRFELTESMDIEQATADADLAQAVSLGVRIGIDDFGTGHSSLTRLHSFPISFLKIDRSFMTDLAPRARSAKLPEHPSLLAAIVQLSNTLEIEAIGEGIETSEQGAALLALGCTYGQGYHYGRPVSAAVMTRLLAGTSSRSH